MSDPVAPAVEGRETKAKPRRCWWGACLMGVTFYFVVTAVGHLAKHEWAWAALMAICALYTYVQRLEALDAHYRRAALPSEGRP